MPLMQGKRGGKQVRILLDIYIKRDCTVGLTDLVVLSAKRLKELGDFFHMDQLINNYTSEKATGKMNNEFDQNHHRQVSLL